MKLGYTKIYGCPKCEQKTCVKSLISGNTFGAILFSDGIQNAPMLPKFPRETKCENCETIFAFNAQNFIENREQFDSLQDCNKAKFLSVKDYQQKIENNQGSEMQNRLLMWHTANGTYGDEFNNCEHAISARNHPLYEENCKKLIIQVGSPKDVDESITLAELHRNIGDFESCVNTITKLPKKLDWLKNQYITQCSNNNTNIFVLENLHKAKNLTK